MLFGGSGTSAKCFNDLQILDRQEMVWLDVSQCDPDNNSRHISEYDGDQHNDHSATFRFGGDYNNNNNMNSYGNNRSAQPSAHLSSGDDHDGMFGNNNGLDGDNQNAPSFSDDATTSVNAPRSHPSYAAPRATDWRSREMAGPMRHAATSPRGPLMQHVSPNPNDEDTVPTVLMHGRGPGRRAGHTATAVNRKIYIFGGSCGRS